MQSKIIFNTQSKTVVKIPAEENKHECKGILGDLTQNFHSLHHEKCIRHNK